MSNPTPHDVYLAKQRLWALVPIGAGKDFNTILKRLEYLEEKHD